MFRGRHFLIAVLLLASVPARAQTNLDVAREAAERGRREYNLGRWQQAIDGFEKAYQLSGDAAFLFNLGQAHRQLGHTGEALRLYRTFLREKPDAVNRSVAEKQIKELEAQPAAGAPPPSATPLPPTPPSPPPQPAQGSTIEVIPAPAPAAPPVRAAPPVAASAPTPAPAAVPSAPAPAPAAVTTVTLSGAPPPPPRRTPLPRWVPLVGAGTTVALIASAAAIGLSASSRFDSLQASCGQTAAGCTSDQIDGVRSRDRAATVLWVLAGVFATATGVSVYVNTREAGASALWRF